MQGKMTGNLLYVGSNHLKQGQSLLNPITVL